MLNPMQNSAKQNYARDTPKSRYYLAPGCGVSTAGSGLSPAPEVLELGRCQLGIPDCVLDGFVPQVILNAPRIVACIGKGVAAGMPEHVDVNREAKQPIGLTQALYKAIGGVWSE
jgi:hypothetical protein